jgi:hypothetical protein
LSEVRPVRQLFGRILHTCKRHELRPVPRIGQLLPRCIRIGKRGIRPRDKRMPNRLHCKHNCGKIRRCSMSDFLHKRKLYIRGKRIRLHTMHSRLILRISQYQLWANRKQDNMSKRVMGRSWRICLHFLQCRIYI